MTSVSDITVRNFFRLLRCGTSGPSLNILIKLMSMVSIVMAGLTIAFM